ncbi:MAG: hypothetical protein ACO1QB_16705 [Verrucomicrobiales bacterium]
MFTTRREGNGYILSVDYLSIVIILVGSNMRTAKQIELAQKVASQQKAIIPELQTLVKDIERCEDGIGALRSALEQVNIKHANRQTTEDDVHYLEDLLACAKKKLVWEKHMASLQKRTPDLMRRVEELVNHPESNPDQETQTALLESINGVKSAMDRLNQSKL